MEKLGYQATDRITGFTGIITGRCSYISGCSQLLLSPKAGKDGGYREPQWFDEQRCLIKVGKPFRLKNGKTPGFDKAPPVR